MSLRCRVLTQALRPLEAYPGPTVLQRLNRLRKKSRLGREDVPQGLKADVFFDRWPDKVVP
jgi:hypothetical protein